MEAISQQLPASTARRSPLITSLTPSQLRRAELAEAHGEPFGTGGQRPPATMSKATRLEDWPEKLRAFLEAQADKPFDWGTHNCSFFAADWVKECCGVDPLGRFRAECTDKKSALKILARKGGVGGLWARLCNKYQWPQVHRYFAQRGDLVLFSGEGGRTGVGICCGESFAALEEQGLGHRDMREATHAFKIG